MITATLEQQKRVGSINYVSSEYQIHLYVSTIYIELMLIKRKANRPILLTPRIVICRKQLENCCNPYGIVECINVRLMWIC